MDFGSFAEGPLLWAVFIVFFVGILARLAFFFFAILTRNRSSHHTWRGLLTTFGRSFLPFHGAFRKRPIYTSLRYLFHICLMVVPIWLSGHIILWEESRFGWTWHALPDLLADRMTLLVLSLAAFFLIRRIAVSHIRRDSSRSDYALIGITALPFMTGYFLTHGTLDAISFLGDHMRTAHVLSGEATMVIALFLFYRTELNGEKCTGCGACDLQCPTGTLEYNDEGRLRVFTYAHYQCICCGKCISTCPEGAAELRHEIGLGRFLQVVSKRTIRSIELVACERCGTAFAPAAQAGKIRGMIPHDFIRFCPRCRKDQYAAGFHQLAPWAKKLKK